MGLLGPGVFLLCILALACHQSLQVQGLQQPASISESRHVRDAAAAAAAEAEAAALWDAGLEDVDGGRDIVDDSGFRHISDSSWWSATLGIFPRNTETNEDVLEEFASDEREVDLSDDSWPISPPPSNHVGGLEERRGGDPHVRLITKRDKDTPLVQYQGGNLQIPSEYILMVELKKPVFKLTETQLNNLQSYVAALLDIPEANVHIDYTQTENDQLALYFVRPDVTADLHSLAMADLIPAQEVENSLDISHVAHQGIALDVQEPISASQGVVVSAKPVPFWEESYFPYVVSAIAIAALLLGFLMAYCLWQYCFREKSLGGQPTRNSPLLSASSLPQQICLYPTAKPCVNSATTIQPEVTQIITNKACGGCGTPVRSITSGSASGSGSPYSSGSQSGTPAPGTPIHTPPLRIKAKGLLERRGSNASLTIDLGSTSSDSPKMGSPPRESSSLEYLLSAGNRMSRKELRNCLQNVKAIYEEFWEIPMNHPDRIEVAGSGMKNRYRTIIPNEATRVKLPELNEDQLSAYINANYIRGYGGEAGAYIATQGPMANTVDDFWRMVWQVKAPIIVMITKLKEKNRSKCECYLPETFSRHHDLDVHQLSISEGDSCIVRQLKLQRGIEEHYITHFWYTAWPDHKAPSTAKHLLHLVKNVEDTRTQHHSQGPTIVHCSAGIGRTGCFIAASIGMHQLRDENMVDILGIVCGMRLDRGGMVQTNEQYEFIHQTLMLYEKELPEWPRVGD